MNRLYVCDESKSNECIFAKSFYSYHRKKLLNFRNALDQTLDTKENQKFSTIQFFKDFV